jgi:hypothetical protein
MFCFVSGYKNLFCTITKKKTLFVLQKKGKTEMNNWAAWLTFFFFELMADSLSIILQGVGWLTFDDVTGRKK